MFSAESLVLGLTRWAVPAGRLLRSSSAGCAPGSTAPALQNGWPLQRDAVRANFITSTASQQVLREGMVRSMFKLR
jgi:hypothetical protein